MYNCIHKIRKNVKIKNIQYFIVITKLETNNIARLHDKMIVYVKYA